MPEVSESYSFKNLELWKAAQKFALDACALADALPPKRSADIAGRQLIRSATSVAANIAEGHGRFSLQAYSNYLSIAKASATESRSWIDLLMRLGHISAERGAELEAQCARLVAALTRRTTQLERARRRQVREAGPSYGANSEEVPRFQGSKVPGRSCGDQP